MTMQADLYAALAKITDVDVVRFGAIEFDEVPVRRAGWAAIVIAADMATPAMTTCGASDADDYRMQIDVYTEDLGKLLSLRDAVFAAVEGEFPTAYRINDLAAYDEEMRLQRRIIEYSIPG